MHQILRRMGNRTVTYSKTWVPWMGVKNNCHARDANDLEKQLFEKSKKKFLFLTRLTNPKCEIREV